jgi:hypothetical protein
VNCSKEPILSAYDAKTEEDRQDLLELARAWTQAALVERRSQEDHYTIRDKVAH